MPQDGNVREDEEARERAPGGGVRTRNGDGSEPSTPDIQEALQAAEVGVPTQAGLMNTPAPTPGWAPPPTPAPVLVQVEPQVAVAPAYAAAPAPTTAPRRRRWPMWVAMITATLVIASLGAATYVSSTNGEAWKNRSREWQRKAGALQARVTRSEADAGALQTRLDGLANEKAQAQDERNAAKTERDLYEGLAVLASQAVVDVASCRNAVSDTLSATISQLGTEYPAWSYLQSMASQADSTCTVASQSYQRFADAVDALY